MRMIQSKSHDHYGEETLAALALFHDMYLSYSKLAKYKMDDSSSNRLDTIQAAWNTFVRARKAETGTGFYLPKQED